MYEKAKDIAKAANIKGGPWEFASIQTASLEECIKTSVDPWIDDLKSDVKLSKPLSVIHKMGLAKARIEIDQLKDSLSVVAS